MTHRAKTHAHARRHLRRASLAAFLFCRVCSSERPGSGKWLHEVQVGQ